MESGVVPVVVGWVTEPRPHPASASTQPRLDAVNALFNKNAEFGLSR